MLARTLAALCCCLFADVASADGTLVSWGPRDLEGMTQERWENAKVRTPEQLLALNESLTSWPETYESMTHNRIGLWHVARRYCCPAIHVSDSRSFA